MGSQTVGRPAVSTLHLALPASGIAAARLVEPIPLSGPRVSQPAPHVVPS